MDDKGELHSACRDDGAEKEISAARDDDSGTFTEKIVEDDQGAISYWIYPDF